MRAFGDASDGKDDDEGADGIVMAWGSGVGEPDDEAVLNPGSAITSIESPARITAALDVGVAFGVAEGNASDTVAASAFSLASPFSSWATLARSRACLSSLSLLSISSSLTRFSSALILASR